MTRPCSSGIAYRVRSIQARDHVLAGGWSAQHEPEIPVPPPELPPETPLEVPPEPGETPPGPLPEIPVQPEELPPPPEPEIT